MWYKVLILIVIVPMFCFGIWDTKVHDINNIELWITNYGKIGPGYWPKGSSYETIFGAGIWFGTVDSITGDTLVTIGYGLHGGETEFAPGLYDQNPDAPYVMIYMYPDPWPAPIDTFPMAPQKPVSEQDSWCCYNDCDPTYHIPGDMRPIGIEVYQTIYVWSLPSLHGVIYFTFEVKNVMGNYLKDCYIGLCADIDVGNEAGTGNDLISAIVGQEYIIGTDTFWVDNLGYQWQEQEAGWAEFPGVFGLDLLQTPFDLVWGEDKDNDGILDQHERDSVYYWHNVPQNKWDVDNDGVPDWRDASENPQLGMTAFKRWILNLGPNEDHERYLTLAGYNFKTGQYEPYDTMMPPVPDVQRFLISSGPFDLEPDSSVTFVIGMMWAYWDTLDARPDTALVGIDDWVQYYYDMYWFYYPGIQENSSQKINTCFSISPNPILYNVKISFSLPKSGLISLKLYDAVGRLVKKVVQGHKSAGSYNIDINTKELAQGTYFLVLETPNGKTSKSLVVLR